MSAPLTTLFALLVFSSREAAEAFAGHDPYVVNGLVGRWEVRPWAVAVGAESIVSHRA